nr:reverse transcriptase domain-containing protein [Tanacetum cinerariifolium]
MEENVPAPTRTDEQLLHVKVRLPIGKNNLLMDLQKKQKNPIFLISMDILQNTNFFRALTASADGVVMGTNVDYEKVIWEEFKQAIKNFFFDMANINIATKKPKHHVIPYCQFTKLIIYYLGGRKNIHRRPRSRVYITVDDYQLGNLKFVSKRGVDEVFGMPIPKDLIMDVIRNSEYYKKYLEIAARKPHQPTNVTDEEGGKKKKKAPKAERYSNGLKSLQAPIGRVVILEPDLGVIRKLLEVEGKGKDFVDETEEFHSIKEIIHLNTRELSIHQFSISITSVTFLIFFKNYDLTDDEPMWAADRVVALTPGFMITILETANDIAIKDSFYNDYRDRYSNHDNWRSSEWNDYNRDNYRSNTDDKSYDLQRQFNDFMKSQQSTNAFVKETFMDLKTQLETVAKNHQAAIQNLETKFDRLVVKQSGRPYRSLPSNTQPNPQAKNMLIEVGKFTFPADFVIIEMEEDNKVPIISGRPFLHTVDAVIRVKQKKLNLGVGTERMIFYIDSAIKHSYSNDDTCFSIDVIDEILEEYFDALLDEGSKILHSIEGTILEEEIFSEFDKFIAMVSKSKVRL